MVLESPQRENRTTDTFYDAAMYGMAALAGIAFLRSNPQMIGKAIRGGATIMKGGRAAYSGAGNLLNKALKTGQQLRPMELSFLRDIEGAAEFTRVVGSQGGVAQDVAEALHQRYGSVRTFGDVRQATVGEFLEIAGKAPTTTIGDDAVRVLGSEYVQETQLSNIRSMIDKGLISPKYALDKSIFMDPARASELLDVRSLDPRNLVSNLVNMGRKIGFYGASPFDALIPFAERGVPAIAEIKGAVKLGQGAVTPLKVGGQEILGQRNFVINNTLYSVEKNGIVHKQAMEKLHLVNSKNPLVEYHLRNQGLADIPQTAEEIVREIPDAFKSSFQKALYEGDAVAMRRIASKVGGTFGSILETYASTGGIFGQHGFIGKQYASKKSFFSDLIDFATKRSAKRGVFDDAGADLRDLGKNILNFSEKHSVGKDLGKRLAAGETLEQAVQHMQRTVYGGSHVAMTKADMAKATLHKLIETPFRIMEATTGFGVRPGTLGQTAKRIAGVSAVSYFGWEAINYADYLAEETTSISPIKTGLGAYTTTMTMQQQLLNLSGITWLADGLADLGIDVDSPLSKAVRFAAVSLAAPRALSLIHI